MNQKSENFQDGGKGGEGVGNSSVESVLNKSLPWRGMDIFGKFY